MHECRCPKSHTQKKETPQIWELELQTVACWMLEVEFKFSIRACTCS